MTGQWQARGDAIGAHLLLNLRRALPGRFFGIGDHRTQRQREAGIAAMTDGGTAHLAYRVLHRFERFAPERIDVGMAPGDLDRLGR